MENHNETTPEEAMARDVEWLLERREEEGLRWTGRQCELVELVYAAAQTGLLLGPDGNRPTVGRLLREVAARLHCQLPRNPGSVYARLRVSMESQYRKSLRCMRMLLRCSLEKGCGISFHIPCITAGHSFPAKNQCCIKLLNSP